MPVRDLHWQAPDASTLVVEFSLPAGAYATAVLREVVNSEKSGDDGDAHED
jgi:tRNA(Glu) U13 pseudouridine synthase TruD